MTQVPVAATDEVPVQRAVAIVHAGAVERNCSRLARELEGRTRLCAVVKADGYGHGALECAAAALRGGASWFAVAAAAEAAELRTGLPDVPLLTMGALTAAELDVALGPGLGRDEDSFELARAVARHARAPLLIDADGLNAHAERLELIAERRAPTVLTPHAGELGRLLGRESREVAEHRLACVREAAKRSRAIVVLKGDDSLAVDGRRLAISAGGSPGLATAGTGDVLSGTIGALLARGMEPFAATCAGVHAHQRAGRIAARRLGCAESVIATDVIAALPAALER